jgi:hypothetical protein
MFYWPNILMSYCPTNLLSSPPPHLPLSIYIKTLPFQIDDLPFHYVASVYVGFWLRKTVISKEKEKEEELEQELRKKKSRN